MVTRVLLTLGVVMVMVMGTKTRLTGNLTKRCGWPGRPMGGRLQVAREGFMLSPAPPTSDHVPGDQVVYSCPSPSRVLLGPPSRVCGEDGRWSPGLPRCGLNLALNATSMQSSTLWTYTADLAVDGDRGSCAWTQRTGGQRWWQVKLQQSSKVKSVRLHMKNEPLLAVTVFTIKLLPNNRTLYKPCGRYNNANFNNNDKERSDDKEQYNSNNINNFEKDNKIKNRKGRNYLPTLITDEQNTLRLPGKDENKLTKTKEDKEVDENTEDIVIDIECNTEDTLGDFVFVRDDRKKAEYFTLCEVEVFTQLTSGDCGDPELPSGAVSQVTSPGQEVTSPGQEVTSAGQEVTSAGQEVTLGCKAGHLLEVGGREVTGGKVVITCSQGGNWNSSEVGCRAVTCSLPPMVENGRVEMTRDLGGRPVKAEYSCEPGHVIWGPSSLLCNVSGAWSATPPACHALTCGHPPSRPHAEARLKNGSALWRDQAVYTCHPGFLMVVNTTSDPLAKEYSTITCLADGEWDGLGLLFTCVDASQLDEGHWLGSTYLSINIIYCLLALLIALSVPLIFLHCCGGCQKWRNCSQKKGEADQGQPIWCQQHPSGAGTGLGQDTLDSCPNSSLLTSLHSSPKAGVYSVSSGLVLQPATVSPSTLRSLSSMGANSFKPFSYTGSSLPLSALLPVPPTPGWRTTQGSLPYQFQSPMGDFIQLPRPGSKHEPVIDESGYASLIVKKEPPVYETVSGARLVPEVEEKTTHRTYDAVPRVCSMHEYANCGVGLGSREGCRVDNSGEDSRVESREGSKVESREGSTTSFPDLLEMVTRSKTPSPRVKELGTLTRPKTCPLPSLDQGEGQGDHTDVARLYAKVDLSRKRSRPNSDDSSTAETVVASNKENLDSYTKTLIDRFNSFLESEGHLDVRK